MAERYKTLKRKSIHGKAHERRTGVCKLPQFTAQMNQYRGIQVRFVELIWRPKSPEMTEVRTIEYGIVCDILAKFSRFETPTKRTGDYLPFACDWSMSWDTKI